MVIGALTVAYREETRITDAIKCLEGHIDRHLVLISEKPWSGKELPMDKTAEIAESLGAEVVTGEWQNEVDQRMLGLQLLKDCDWVIIIDADEYYEPKSVKKLIQFVKTANINAYGITNMRTYWKTRDYIIEPPEGGGRLVLIRPSVEIVTSLCVNEPWGFLPEEIVMHHYSYVRTNGEMKAKVAYFGKIENFVPNWYENIWLKWTPEMENLHPVNPQSFRKAKWNTKNTTII